MRRSTDRYTHVYVYVLGMRNEEEFLQIHTCVCVCAGKYMPYNIHTYTNTVHILA
jgi:hypothetical protein